MPTNYDEEKLRNYVRIFMIMDFLILWQGDGSATVWTCDLSHDYVSINGHYRTKQQTLS